MKRLDLENGYVVDIDDRNFTLKSNVRLGKPDKDGNPTETCTVHGYYGQMEHLFNELLKLLVISKGPDVVNPREFYCILLEAKSEIKKLTDKFEFGF